MFLSKLAESISQINPFSNQTTTADSSPDDNTDPEIDTVKRRRLETQKRAEELAESNGVFAKKQRVFYNNKSTDTMHDAYIVGVHFDDGPDKPYYTIRYRKQQEEVQNDGSTKTILVEVEKQTTPDRLYRLEWDEEKSWRVLQ